MTALDRGFEVYIVVDASAATTEETHNTAVMRLLQTGAIPVNCLAVGSEILRGRADQPLAPAFGELICEHLPSWRTVAARMAGLAWPTVRRGGGGRRARPRRRSAVLDRVRRDFTAVAPDVPWCGDVTQSDTGEGPLGLATTSEYTAARTAAACRRHGITQSMGRVGAHSATPPPRRPTAHSRPSPCTGRARAPAEPVHRHHFTTRAEARIKISTWIADFSNTRRRRSADHGARPVTFEQRMTQARESPPPRPAVRSAPAKAGP